MLYDSLLEELSLILNTGGILLQQALTIIELIDIMFICIKN
jgi:hypothetical protein